MAAVVLFAAVPLVPTRAFCSAPGEGEDEGEGEGEGEGSTSAPHSRRLGVARGQRTSPCVR